MTELAAKPQLNLTVPGGVTFDLYPVYEALGFSFDFVNAVDAQNAAKNLAEPRPSPLAVTLKDSLTLLHGIFTEHGTNLDEPEIVDGELVDA